MRPVGRLVLDRRVDNFFAETEQVAFCTQNVVPGIDFTNDPLLQGRNFSYLDTQLKRLGGPNFTHIPINAPKCPFAQLPAGRPHGDAQPQGPGQLRAELLGRRPAARARARTTGYQLVPGRRRRRQASASGPRPSPTTTARPGSSTSARPPVEQTHIADALTFELSKVETPAIRARMVVAPAQHRRGPGQDRGRGPAAAGDARAGRPPPGRPGMDLEPSPALSILKNGPKSFAGRKVGALVTDGVDAELLAALRRPLEGGRGDARAGRARRSAASRTPTAPGTTPTRRSTAAPRSCSTPSRSCPPTEGAAELTDAPAGPRLRRRRLRPPQVHRLHADAMPLLREGRRPGQPRRRLRPPEGRRRTATIRRPCRKLRFWERADAER